MRINWLFFIACLLIILVSFSIEKFKLKLPIEFGKPYYNFENNIPDKNKIFLGRVLFYDPILSKNNTISCASCHNVYNAFAHSDHALSHGIFDSIGKRNSPALINLAWNKSFMWDGAINHLDMQSLAPISHPLEMASTIDSVLAKLSASNFYKSLFKKAWNDSIPSGERVLKSLSQFMFTLISANSKYDLVKKGKEKFTIQEKKGYELFKQFCNHCHTEPLFTTYDFKNNGLSVNTKLHDSGRYQITKNKNDMFLFKIPTLRNVEYSFPYMHDGRYNSLYDVLNHYQHINYNAFNLSSDLIQHKIELTADDKTDLVTFLLTLSDKTFIFNPNLAFPRKKN